MNTGVPGIFLSAALGVHVQQTQWPSAQGLDAEPGSSLAQDWSGNVEIIVPTSIESPLSASASTHPLTISTPLPAEKKAVEKGSKNTLLPVTES